MKQLSMPLKPLSVAILSAIGLNAHAALYEIIDLGNTDEDEVHTYAQSGSSAVGSSGTVVGIGSIEDSYEIDHDAIDFDEVDEDQVVIEDDDDDDDVDIDDLVIDFSDYEIEDEDLKDMDEYAGTYYPIYNDSFGGWERVYPFDYIVDSDGEYSGTTDTYFSHMNDEGVAVGYGSAPYIIYTWEDEDDDGDEYENGTIIREFESRAFAYNIGEDSDTVVALESEGDEYGGWSAAYGINNNGLVIGIATTEINEDSEEDIEDCIDDDVYPEELCNQLIEYEDSSAVVWEISESLETAEMHEIDMMFEPSDVYYYGYYVRLRGINDNDYIVGESYGYSDLDQPDEEDIGTYAAIWTEFSNQDVGVIDPTDRDTYTSSTAIDINNNDIVIGTATRLINGTTRTKTWYYDLSEDFSDLTEIPSEFNSSSSWVKDINNNNQMVGVFEWEARPAGVTRRTHAYMYEVGDDEFIDLNDAISCDSDYEIVEANAITDDGLILATALVNVPLLDDEDEPIFDTDGFEMTQLVARAVALREIEGGQIGECEDSDESTPDNERQGASFGWLLLALPTLMWFRRKFKS